MRMFWTGVSISAIYFISLGLIIYKLDLALMSTLNEFGDFLAGAFSPVAFLWLVLGYLQQQKELQQNTKALELQATELKNSVDQYKEMVAVAKEQLSMDVNSLESARKEREHLFKPIIKAPNLAPSSVTGGTTYKYRGQLLIAGEDALSIFIKTVPGFKPFDGYSADILKAGSVNLGESAEVKSVDLPDSLLLIISYESKLQIRYFDEYKYSLDGNGIYKLI